MSSFPDHQFPHDPVAARNSTTASWRQIIKRALDQSTWKLIKSTHPESRDAVKTQSSPSRAPRIFIGLAVAVLLLIAVPIVLIIRAESSRPHYYRQGKSVVSRGESLLGMNQISTKPKPSPYKYTLATPVTKPSASIVITPHPQAQYAPPTTAQQQLPNQASPVTPAVPQTAINMPPPPPSAAGARVPFTPVVYSARHDKHFGGCSGQLTLNAGGLNFNCASEPGDSINVGLNDIGAVDENGIQTTSGKKYHFTITGMSKPGAQQLFSNWLHQVR
ncbi:hypothetical protein [Occallatibacter savannae]|uniref:hypothetical protein n=1 Tax=Occallatibacter savannae TaxID=1002691 RepID=UPI000D68D34F|nr:hypothetical protein [Occallatibacter savannae]